jgi:hypothetical protein
LALSRLEKSRTARPARLNQIAALALWLTVSACAKEKPKPVHTEPWLAHPPASALASTDAALPTTRYVLAPQSVIRFELSTKRGKVQGRITKLSGELTVVLGALAQSRGQVRVDLSSLALDDDANSATWLGRVQSALGGGDAGGAANATFDLTGFDDVSPEAIEPARAADGGTPPRKARGTAVGNLLLNGFRVQKRQPLEAEFSFGSDRTVPTKLAIRSRTPLVVSLETHELHLHEPSENRERRRNRAAPAPHDVRVTLELYATKE